MRLAVISCAKYSDAWKPFFYFLDKYWPDHPTSHLITDEIPLAAMGIFSNGLVHRYGNKESWCGMLAHFARKYNDQPICLMLEDYFLTQPVNDDLIEYGLDQMKRKNAGMVRFYPCPGADIDYGDPFYGMVKPGTRYRISTQMGAFDPEYLHRIASQFKTPQEFELSGTIESEQLKEPILAFKRDVQPWPVQYVCTGIVNGEWSQGAVDLCERHGLDVDFSRRPMQV